MQTDLQLILGNQLFPLENLPPPQGTMVFMAEDIALCTYVRHHKQKLILVLAAMRNYANALKDAGYDVRYDALDIGDERSYEDKLTEALRSSGAQRLRYFEIEDKFMEERIERCAAMEGVETIISSSPMFICSRARFAEYLQRANTPRMADFYVQERRRLGLLLDAAGAPAGGRWSFDAENRKKLPANLAIPELPALDTQPHVTEVRQLVTAHFDGHPGADGPLWLPVTRQAALEWLEEFVSKRLELFGPYEDAISRRSRTLFHSVLSPSLNLGLITPREVIDRALIQANDHDVPLASLEGLIRQIIGWREFVRGIYRNFSDVQETENFWNHERRLTEAWYTGKTGILPLDDAISSALKLGWDHHIARLMIVGNLMTLCEIQPRAAHRWFMEMYVDSYDWVMGPNVYGMALFSDGGIFATKPYVCGSNYLLKMSDYKRDDWCDTVDGLYWRFIEKHRDFFARNPRLAVMPRALDRLKPGRKAKILAAAERFLAQYTYH